MNVIFSPGAWRQWKKLSTEVQDRLRLKLLKYASDPLRFATKLHEPAIGQYRFRIGEYRVIFDLHRGELVVLAVGHRKEIYR